MKIQSNKFENAEEIVAKAESYASLFMDYPESPPERLFNPYRDTYDQQDDQFHVLRMGYNMPDDLTELIVESLGLSEKDREKDIRINRYDPGDYLQPRRDERRKGIFVLTTSVHDGLTIADEAGRFKRITDAAGTYIITSRETWHWVDPVRGGTRYVIVTDPPIIDRAPPKEDDRRQASRDGRDRRAAPRPRTTGILAKGSTAVIYETEAPEIVLKTCWRTDPYDTFLKVVDQTESRHLPVIHRAATNPDGRQWVELERLWPLGEDDPLWPVVNAFANYCYAVADRRPAEAPDILSEELVELAKVLAQKSRRHHHSLDLSFANIMVRPDTDEIVVIDPYW